MPKLSILRFLCFRCSRSAKTPQGDSCNATGVSSSCPSSELGTSQEALIGHHDSTPESSFLQFLCFRRRRPRPPEPTRSNAIGASSYLDPSLQSDTPPQAHRGSIVAAQSISGDSASQLTPDLQAVTSPVKSNSVLGLTPHSSVAFPPTHPASPSETTDSDPSQHQDLFGAPQLSPAIGSLSPLLSQRSTQPPLQQPQDGRQGMRYVSQNTHESRNVSVEGDMNQVLYYHTNTIVKTSNRFMEKLLEKTIPGAAFDSSTRDPPPRCHPGTRLAILARCLEFIANCTDKKKVRWVVGAAGVGKSAIMQNVAESSVFCGASIFFSIDGRNDGNKAIITLAYQLAAKCEPYRVLIEYEITRDPSLLRSSISVQFKKFFIEPFVHHPQINSLNRVLVIIDGLDECDKSHTQRELLQLISDFCSTYPSSPIVWIIASRPEPHITSFFAQDHVKAVYEREEVLIDSDEARNDVEKYLRNELTKIQNEFSLNPQSQWPPEQDLWKLANASSGLFVYAHTVIKYVGDPTLGNPTSQLNDVIKVIDAHPLSRVAQEEHPFARLDMLYARILSKVPEKIVANTRKILLALVLDSRRERTRRKGNFVMLCNWLGMTCDDAYAAIRHLHSVLLAPKRDKAHKVELRTYHKSFVDYVSDSARSRLFCDIEREARDLEVECTIRILAQAQDGIDFGDMVYDMVYVVRGSKSLTGALARGPGTGRGISLIWPFDTKIASNNDATRLNMYKLAFSNVLEGIRNGESAFCTVFCIRLVTTRWHFYNLIHFPFRELQNLVFETSRRHEFMKHGIFRQVPVKVLNLACIVWNARLQFRRPSTTTPSLPDPWTLSCKHNRAGNWAQGKDEDWTTEFGMTRGVTFRCHSCCNRLERQLEIYKTRAPDHVVTILFTSTGTCFVEFQFIDPSDEVSEWTYWLVYYIPEEERRKLGSPV